MAKVSNATKRNRKNARQVRAAYKIACFVSCFGIAFVIILFCYPQLFHECANLINRITSFFS